MPMRSIAPLGRPRVNLFHVVPPSVDLYSAVSAPPLSKYHAQRRNVYIPAYTMFAFVGSMSTSEHPVRLFLKSTLCHALPPSVVLNNPRSSFGDRKSTRLNSSHRC